MWQTWIVLLVVAVVLVYVIRHYVRAARCETSLCGSCGGCSLEHHRSQDQGE